MTSFRLTPFALDDIDEILSYLEREASVDVALKTEQRLFDSFERLAAIPGLGHLRSDLTALPFHFFAAPPYLIVYERDRQPLTIHAVLHASRDLPPLLEERS